MTKEIKRGQVFGLNIGRQFAYYNQDSQSLKMSGLYLIEDLRPCLQILPKSGIMQNGKLFQQRIWVRHTKGKESGLLPTPTSSPCDVSQTVEATKRLNKSRTRKQGTLMERVVEKEKWPTPTTRMNECQANIEKLTRGVKVRDSGQKIQRNLADVVAIKEKWPTPVSTMYKGSSKGSMTRKSGKSRANDRLDFAVEKGTGQLSPKWVDWLMGYPVNWTELKNDKMFKLSETNKEQKVLHPDMLLGAQKENEQKLNKKCRSEKNSKNDNTNDLRKVYINKESSKTSQGQRSDKYKNGKYSDTMSEMPHEGTHEKQNMGNNWIEEPDISRLTTGVEDRVNRLKGLGNSIIPQISELLFNQIKQYL